jgi:hypothetical protein
LPLLSAAGRDEQPVVGRISVDDLAKELGSQGPRPFAEQKWKAIQIELPGLMTSAAAACRRLSAMIYVATFGP